MCGRDNGLLAFATQRTWSGNEEDDFSQPKVNTNRKKTKEGKEK